MPIAANFDSALETHVVLVRGINVGGNKMVAMADLRDLASRLGFRDARTVLQSGNLIFRAGPMHRQDLEDQLAAEAEQRLGLKAEFFARTAGEWAKVIQGNPFPDEARADPSHLLVVFTKHSPDPEAVKAVQAAVVGREVIRVAADHLYVIYPDGIGDSKLPKTPGWKELAGSGTARNWNTLLRISSAL